MQFCLPNRLPVRTTQGSRIQEIIQQGKHAASLEVWLSKYSDLWDSLLLSLFMVEWSVFGTLTWKDDNLRMDTESAQRVRENDFSRLIELTARDFNIRRKQLKYYHATERGSGRGCHLHFAIAKDGIGAIDSALLAARMEAIWAKEFVGPNRRGGVSEQADVQAFDKDRKLEGLCYLTKREYAPDGREYEGYRKTSDRLHSLMVRLIEGKEQRGVISPAKVLSVPKFSKVPIIRVTDRTPNYHRTDTI